MLVLNRGQERDEDLAPATRRGDAYVADKNIRPFRGQKLDLIYLQLRRNWILCQQTKCVLYGVYTYRDELPVFCFKLCFCLFFVKEIRNLCFWKKNVYEQKKLSPGCSNEVEADAELCEAVASMEQRRNCERRVWRKIVLQNSSPLNKILYASLALFMLL